MGREENRSNWNLQRFCFLWLATFVVDGCRDIHAAANFAWLLTQTPHCATSRDRCKLQHFVRKGIVTSALRLVAFSEGRCLHITDTRMVGSTRVTTCNKQTIARITWSVRLGASADATTSATPSPTTHPPKRTPVQPLPTFPLPTSHLSFHHHPTLPCLASCESSEKCVALPAQSRALSNCFAHGVSLRIGEKQLLDVPLGLVETLELEAPTSQVRVRTELFLRWLHVLKHSQTIQSQYVAVFEDCFDLNTRLELSSGAWWCQPRTLQQCPQLAILQPAKGLSKPCGPAADWQGWLQDKRRNKATHVSPLSLQDLGEAEEAILALSQPGMSALQNRSLAAWGILVAWCSVWTAGPAFTAAQP